MDCLSGCCRPLALTGTGTLVQSTTDSADSSDSSPLVLPSPIRVCDALCRSSRYEQLALAHEPTPKRKPLRSKSLALQRHTAGPHCQRYDKQSGRRDNDLGLADGGKVRGQGLCSS